MENEWLRARFETNGEDPRPVEFPPPGPYWVSGYSGDGEKAIVVAYIKDSKDLDKYWPDAEDVTISCAEGIQFSERFPKPDWWTDTKGKSYDGAVKEHEKDTFSCAGIISKLTKERDEARAFAGSLEGQLRMADELWKVERAKSAKLVEALRTAASAGSHPVDIREDARQAIAEYEDEIEKLEASRQEAGEK